MREGAAGPQQNVSGEELAAPALRGFFRLADVWRLTVQEQMKLLGLTRRSTLEDWKIGITSEVNAETIERISYLLGIFKAINTLLPIRARADAWMRTTNKAPLFDGRSALDFMTMGDLSDLHAVRRHLDEQLG